MNIVDTSPWISADMEQWRPLQEGYPAAAYKKNSVLYSQEEMPRFVYIVVSGRVCVTSYQMSGAEKQLYIAERGALFGEEACLMELPHTTTAVTIVDSQLFAIPWERVREAMQRDRELTSHMIQMLCRKNLILQQQVVELSSSDAEQRIAQVLVNLSRQYGTKERGGIRIHLRFTHQDVANLINASRVTVSNVFSALAAQGILEKQGGQCFIRDPRRLEGKIQGILQ